jgi:hypothetical protein
MLEINLFNIANTWLVLLSDYHVHNHLKDLEEMPTAFRMVSTIAGESKNL